MADYVQDTGRELGWNDTIENDSPEYVTLPEGEYEFEVIDFERGRHSPKPDGKLPACNKAVLQLKIEAPEGIAIIQEQLFLHSSMEGKLCSFFTCIGQRAKGERKTMNWNAVKGARGRCKIFIDTWTNDKGQEYTSNKVKRYLEPAEQPAPTQYQAGRF